MADVVYGNFAKDVATGVIDMDTDDLWIMLVTATYTPNADTHHYRSDVTNEVSGTGYTAGGMDLGTITPTLDTTNNRVTFDAPDPVWTGASITARGAVVYKKRGGAATADELVCYLDFGADVTSTAADFTVALASAGFVAINY